jgi:hypothetical protein
MDRKGACRIVWMINRIIKPWRNAPATSEELWPGTPFLEQRLGGIEHARPVITPWSHAELVEQHPDNGLKAHASGQQMQTSQLAGLGVQMWPWFAMRASLSVSRVPMPQDQLISCSGVDPVAVGAGRDLPWPMLTWSLDQLILLLNVQRRASATGAGGQRDRLLRSTKRLDLRWPRRPVDQISAGHAGQRALQGVNKRSERLAWSPSGQAASLVGQRQQQRESEDVVVVWVKLASFIAAAELLTTQAEEPAGTLIKEPPTFVSGQLARAGLVGGFG